MSDSPSHATHRATAALSRIGIAYAAFFLLAYGGQLLLAAPLLSLLPEAVAEAPLTLWLSTLGPMYALGLPIFFLIARPIPESIPEPKRLRLRHFLLFFAVSYAVMYFTNLLGVGINYLTDFALGRSSAAGATEMIQSSPILYTLLFAVILGPCVEELMFRRLILARLRPHGDGFAILVSSLFFGAFHGNLAQFFYAFSVGLLLGYLYTATGRMRYPILLHVCLNFVGSIPPLLILRLSGADTLESLGSVEAVSPEALAAALPALLLLFGYALLVLAAVGAGLLLLPSLLRRVRLAPASLPIPRGEGRRLLLSPGVLLFAAATLVNLILSYL